MNVKFFALAIVCLWSVSPLHADSFGRGEYRTTNHRAHRPTVIYVLPPPPPVPPKPIAPEFKKGQWVVPQQNRRTPSVYQAPDDLRDARRPEDLARIYGTTPASE